MSSWFYRKGAPVAPPPPVMSREEYDDEERRGRGLNTERNRTRSLTFHFKLKFHFVFDAIKARGVPPEKRNREDYRVEADKSHIKV
ncbi:hypothetical protein Trydic_g11818 [Trypoxylus dichotomus]